MALKKVSQACALPDLAEALVINFNPAYVFAPMPDQRAKAKKPGSSPVWKREGFSGDEKISSQPAPFQNRKWSWHSWGMGLLIFLLAFMVYWPALSGDYLWDDNVMLTENRLVQTADGWKGIWFSTKPHDYLPVTLTSFWLEWPLWKMNSLGYHVTNVALHAGGAVLLWCVLRRLSMPGAWLAAAVFAVHPVCVPSVAWIAERKNALSLVFYLLALLFYLREEERGQVSGAGCQVSGAAHFPQHVSRWYFLSLFAFLLALLSKASVVMLPVVLLGLAWWRQGKIVKRDWLRTLPFFLLSLGLGLVTIWFQKHRAIGGGGGTDDFLIRILGGGWAVWFYLGKALCPVDLMMIYPRWEISSGSVLAWLPGLLWLGMFGVFWRFRQSWGRPWLFGLGYFFITLSPVLGGFAMSFFMHSRVADHLQYLPLMGVVTLVVSGGIFLWQQKFASHFSPGRLQAVATALLLLLSFLSWQRAHAFVHSENLWRDNVRKNPGAWGAYNNLGLVLAQQGKTAEAMGHYRDSIRAKPDYANAHNNLGLALHDQKKYDEAITHYQAALHSEPKFADVHNNLGNALMEQGKLDEAVASYRTALKYKPAFAFTHNNLGYALARQKKYDEAISHYRSALQLNPGYAMAHHNLGRAFSQQGKSNEAIASFREALRLNPGYAEAQFNLANTLFDAGQLDAALVEFPKALQLRPQQVETHNAFGIALAMKGNLPEAMRHFTEALRLQPTNTFALGNLGNAYAHQGKLDEAIEKYEVVLRLDPADAGTHANLGTALLEKKRFTEAIAHFTAALKIEPGNPQTHFHCGLAFVRSGKKTEAIASFREALRLKPDYAEAQKQWQALSGAAPP